MIGNNDSWIVRNRETGEAVTETFSRVLAISVTDEFEAVPALQHLQELNRKGTKAYQWARRNEA